MLQQSSQLKKGSQVNTADSCWFFITAGSWDRSCWPWLRFVHSGVGCSEEIDQVLESKDLPPTCWQGMAREQRIRSPQNKTLHQTHQMASYTWLCTTQVIGVICMFSNVFHHFFFFSRSMFFVAHSQLLARKYLGWSWPWGRWSIRDWIMLMSLQPVILKTVKWWQINLQQKLVDKSSGCEIDQRLQNDTPIGWWKAPISQMIEHF